MLGVHPKVRSCFLDCRIHLLLLIQGKTPLNGQNHSLLTGDSLIDITVLWRPEGRPAVVKSLLLPLFKTLDLVVVFITAQRRSRCAVLHMHPLYLCLP